MGSHFAKGAKSWISLKLMGFVMNQHRNAGGWLVGWLVG